MRTEVMKNWLTMKTWELADFPWKSAKLSAVNHFVIERTSDDFSILLTTKNSCITCLFYRNSILMWISSDQFLLEKKKVLFHWLFDWVPLNQKCPFSSLKWIPSTISTLSPANLNYFLLPFNPLHIHFKSTVFSTSFSMKNSLSMSLSMKNSISSKTILQKWRRNKDIPM